MMHDEAMIQFKQSLRGHLIDRADAGYEEARKLYNAMIDKRPLMIVKCADVADVVAAVGFAREHDLRVAIRGGGHNGPYTEQTKAIAE
jgi:FAD/FMN-containing dehydrogenase